MNINNGKQVLAAFCGIVLVILGFYYLPDTLYTLKTKDSAKMPVYCVEDAGKRIAITFDTAAGNGDTQEILKILEEKKVKATFFITGAFADTYPEDIKAIAQAGHDLGNHSQNHWHMLEFNKKECMEEIKTLHNKVKELTGKDMTLFRPPYGKYNDIIMDAAQKQGYTVIMWSCDSLDWRNYGVDSIINETIHNKNLTDGAIILMHNGGVYTKEALPVIIDKIRDKGYTIVAVSQLIDKKHMD